MATPIRLFVEERTGRLMRLQEHELSRYEFEIWFEYTRAAMSQVREGAMVAVANFASQGEERHLSILEITALKPVHYALGDNPDGYPGFVMEAARNASQDWTAQEDRSEEDTTIIRCTAIPTNLEIVLRLGETPELGPESNIPMIGADARLLDWTVVERVVNRGIMPDQEAVAVAGAWVRDGRVRVLLRVEDFLKLHFGIFGFTGAGKSNLVSTFAATVSSAIENSKVVLFDLMGEYGTLLIDRLNSVQHGYIICLGERSIPQGVFDCINRNEGAPSLQQAANQLVRFFLLPKALLPYREPLRQAFEHLLEQRKIRVFSELQNARVNDAIADERNPWRSRNAPWHRQAISTIVGRVFGQYRDSNPNLTEGFARQLHQQLEQQLQQDSNGQYRQDFQGVLRFLEQVREAAQHQLRCAISLSDILNVLDGDGHALFVIISHNPHDLRLFARRLGEAAYESRRRSGRIEPLVSFIFDEADEFIAQQAAGSYEDSKEIAETLARRGRKFGLGLGIATQRIRYLDTSIMAQPHTYMVSKLPRRTDREAVAEAFGMSDEILRQTFTFQAGDWLLVSHDATGLKAVPVPIHAQDANQRIIAYLQQLTATAAQR